MNQKKNMTNENRRLLRVYCKGDSTPLLEMKDKTYTIIDISEDSVRFRLEKDSIPTQGELKFTDGRAFAFTGRIKRIKDDEFVICFKKDSASALSTIIEQDLLDKRAYQNPNTKEKRKIQRYAYTDKTSVTLDGHEYGLIDISSTAIRFRVDKDNAALQCQGKIVFPDGDDYPVEGILLRLMDKEAVLIFSSVGIPDSRIAKEVYASIDDYW